MDTLKGKNGESMAELMKDYIMKNTLPDEPPSSEDFRLHLLVDDDMRKDYWLGTLNEKIPKVLCKVLLTEEERQRTRKKRIIEQLTPALPEESEVDQAFKIVDKFRNYWGPNELAKLEQAVKNMNAFYKMRNSSLGSPWLGVKPEDRKRRKDVYKQINTACRGND